MATATKTIGREVRIQEKDGPRFYQILPPPAPPYVSVTTPLNMINKPALTAWKVNQQTQATMDAAWKVFESLKSPLVIKDKIDREFFQSLIKAELGKKPAADKESDIAKDIGSEGHEMIEWHCRKQMGQKVGSMPKISDPAAISFMGFEDFQRDNDFLPTHSELVVYNHQYQVAGTVDLIGYIGKARKLALIDIKTGKGIWPESFCQVACYYECLKSMGMPVDECYIVRLPKTLTDPQVEIRPIENLDFHFKAFLAALELFNWNHKQSKNRGTK